MNKHLDVAVLETHHEPKPFGYLLTLDLYGCAAGASDDLNLCYRFLETLVTKLGMTAQCPPYIFRSPLQFPDKAGLSGWVGLIESGIQIHTLTARNFISIDIYCCHEFDSEHVVSVASDFFGPKAVEMNQLARGLKYHEVV